MPFSSFFSDLYHASVAPRVVVAEAPRANVNEGMATGGDNGSSGTAQTRGHAGVRGGVSTKTPASSKASGESGEEAEVNKADASRQKGASSSSGNGDSSIGENEEKQQQQGGGIESKLKDCVTSGKIVPEKKQYNDCISQGNGDCTEELFNLAQRITQCAALEKSTSQEA